MNEINHVRKKIGLIGCAKIVTMSIMNPLARMKELEVYCIASRKKEKAESFARQYGIPVVFDTYQELLECKDIDFVYIALPNDLHMEWAIKAAQACKHVLVEKPLCLDTEEFLKIEKACTDYPVFLLEGVMVQHHPWQTFIKDIIQDCRYGQLKNVKTQISFIPKEDMANNYRSFPEKGGGAFYDLGVYWLQFMQCIGDIEKAKYDGNSTFAGLNGCDWTFNASLAFEEGVTAEFIASFEMKYKAAHTLEFDKAIVAIDDFFRANLGEYKITVSIEDIEAGTKENKVFAAQNYYQNQLKFFSEVIDGKIENIPLKESYQRIKTMQEIYSIAKKKSV